MSIEMIVLIAIFVITLLLGVPIMWSMSLACIASCLVSGDVPFAFFAQKMEAGTEKFTFLAIFFFMLAGAIMQHGGISKRLVNLAKALFGNVSGGLAIVVIVVCMFFAALTGSSIATTAAIGAMLYPELVEAGYPKGFAAALPVAGGTLGIVIPPSIPFVIYGTTVNTSVAKLLLSGVVPGIMAGVAMCIYVYLFSKKNHLPKGEKSSAQEILIAFKDSILALIMPIIILGGIYAGIFTPTESAVVAVVYGLIVSCFVYRELKLKKLLNVVIDSVKGTANVMILIMAAGVLGWVLTRNNIPTIVTTALTTIFASKISFLLCLNVLLIFLGMIMDTGAIILIVAPLIYPIAMSLGIDPIQLGCIVVFNLSVGQATPPFGNCLFAATSATDQDIVSLSKNSFPFVIILYVCVLLTSFVPAISTWLPSMMK